MGSIVNSISDAVSDVSDAIGDYGVNLLLNPALNVPPPETWPAIATVVGGFAAGPIGAVFGGNLGEVKGMPFPC